MGYGVGVGVAGGRTGRALPTAGADGTGRLPLWLRDWDLTTADSSEAVSDPWEGVSFSTFGRGCVSVSLAER